VARCGPDFAVLSGDDPSCLAAMQNGAAGVVSVAANIVPALMQRLCASVQAQDTALVRELDERLQPLYEALAIETNPIPVKWALFEMKLIGPQIRLPLTQLDDTHREALRNCLASLELLDD
jgi:4-hydroxy-tetrahydrodipicolinate synthase